MRYVAVLLAALAAPACQSPATLPEGGYVDSVFVGENIITVDPENAGADGIAVRGAEIVFVGDRDGAMAYAGPDTRVEELGERALIPGLIDTHGHFPFTMRLLDLADLSPPPVGSVESIDDLVAVLKQYIADNNIPAGNFVMGYGYDDSLLAEGRHPTRDDLDRISTDHLIGIMHVSAHLAVANSPALAAFDIGPNSDNPPGGVIRRRADSNEPNGVLEETAAYAVIGPIAMSGSDNFDAQVRDAARHYASFGITTAQDGAANPDDIAKFEVASKRAALPIDIAAFPVVNRYPLEAISAMQSNAYYIGGFRVAGAKLSLDGSPQGRTAWLTEPYNEGPVGAAADYVAYPTLDPEKYRASVATLIANDVPLIAHANGDAAIDLMLEGVAAALEATPKSDHRAVIIHAQLMREDQMDVAAKLGVVPSFFSAHPFFWGDWHRKSFGKERAANISPVQWAIERDVPFTIHNDSPVIPPDMMRLWWITVNRKTRSGHVLGESQRATAEQALHAMTLGAAYQYFEEDRKGSISVGKQADLVILDRNPLEIDPDDLLNVQVLETIARGNSVFRADCDRLTDSEIKGMFADVVDNAIVKDIEDGKATNHWNADGTFTSEWSSADSGGSVSGTWHAEGNQRCVDIEGNTTCSPLFQCGTEIMSTNADGSTHGVHRLSPQ